MSCDRPIFKTGERYRVKQSFMSGPSTFTVDELVTFDRDGYSRYDNCFVYEFRSQTDGQTKFWWLHEDQPSTTWQQFFGLPD
jgi:hypothetical protein